MVNFFVLTPFCLYMKLHKKTFNLKPCILLVDSEELSLISWLVGWNHDERGYIIGAKPFTLINTKCPRFYSALRHFSAAIIKQNTCYLLFMQCRYFKLLGTERALRWRNASCSVILWWLPKAKPGRGLSDHTHLIIQLFISQRCSIKFTGVL
jgi:hypothetical protein